MPNSQEVVLTQAEATALDECEMRIAKGLRTFVEVGEALVRIRDGRLYRTTYGSFEEYCRDRWNISRTRAYELIAANEVVSAIADTGAVPPVNEAQARELGRVPEPDRADTWRRAVEATDGKPTAAAIRAARDQPDEPQATDETVVVNTRTGEVIDNPPTPAPARKRRPLPDAFRDAIGELTKVADRLERLATDDRLTQHAERVRAMAGADLLRITEQLTTVFGLITNSRDGSS